MLKVGDRVQVSEQGLLAVPVGVDGVVKKVIPKQEGFWYVVEFVYFDGTVYEQLAVAEEIEKVEE